MPDPTRLLRARRIAVIGGGAWAASIVKAASAIGFSGELTAVHPRAAEVGGLTPVRDLSEIAGGIDAAFIGVNRETTIGLVRDLAARGAGGAVCFASGFRETFDGVDLETELVAAAGDMPILGPNCYGFVNALDRVAIWPDQHGMTPVDRGVAVLFQSSNIAINVTMQRRSLPLAMVVTCGNQAQTRQADIALALLEDPRITAIGLHIEGFGDVAAWHRFALAARDRGVPVVAMKPGRSEAAQQAMLSHTASLAGGDAGAGALLRHLGFGRAHDLPTFLETLKLAHMVGRIDPPTLACISCSGGEAALCADTVANTALTLPTLTNPQREALGAALGSKVALANPLDYHTYVWRDAATMSAAWRAMSGDHIGMTLSVVDYPHTDAADWDCATEAALAARAQTGRPFGVVATLPELMPGDVAARLVAGGVVPFHGLREAVAAVEIAALTPAAQDAAPLPAGPVDSPVTLDEAAAKFALSEVALDLPRRVACASVDLPSAAHGLAPPLVLKTRGAAHKSDAGGVRLGLTADELAAVAEEMGAAEVLVEEMVTDGIAELLIGVTRDPAHGLLLTLGAGGTETEIWQDTVTLLLPVTEVQVTDAFGGLKVARLLDGFRGRPGASWPAILAAVMAVQEYVRRHHGTLSELEINPLICTPTRAVVADALIRMEDPDGDDRDAP